MVMIWVRGNISIRPDPSIISIMQILSGLDLYRLLRFFLKLSIGSDSWIGDHSYLKHHQHCRLLVVMREVSSSLLETFSIMRGTYLWLFGFFSTTPLHSITYNVVFLWFWSLWSKVYRVIRFMCGRLGKHSLSVFIFFFQTWRSFHIFSCSYLSVFFNYIILRWVLYNLMIWTHFLNFV